MKTYYVYILVSKYGTLYVGVTNNLERRIYEHKNKMVKGFSSRYNIDKLVFFEGFSQINDAIAAEKRIKGWKRAKKLDLVKSINPDIVELFPS